MTVPDEQFKYFIAGLLGNKDQEEVFKRLSQVDKATLAKRDRDSSRGMIRLKPYQSSSLMLLLQWFWPLPEELLCSHERGARKRASKGTGPSPIDCLISSDL